MSDTTLFQVHRLQLVAYFLAKGAELDHHERDGETVYFWFKDPELCEKLRSEFLSPGTAERIYWNRINDVKDIIFSSRR